MKAMVITGFGDAGVFEQRELPKPEPGIGELLVKVYAASVNPVDYKIRTNGSWAVTPPVIIGYDASGVVEKCGPGVKDFKPGDEIFYTPIIEQGHGTYAEYAVVHEDIVALKPKNISFLEAAGLPLAGCTALDAIVNLARVKPGENVLIHAGAGGVGSFALQLAKISGARVATTCSPKNIDLVRSLGADIAIDYRKEDFAKAFFRETGGELADVVFDTVGGDTTARSMEITKKFGRIVSIVNISGNINAGHRKNIVLYLLFLERAKHKIEMMRTLVEEGKIRTAVDSVFPLNRVADAHRKIEQGGVRGKIILQVSGE
ncbi:MAG: zinc-binding dehydrogenase [Ignavibacteria bacterium]|jgi:NADPH2:quinone reductase|nr:zinc-binding dehydrogenase [Ignavibacteria bacterium]MCU7504335.1 zinc-binding dehydrogenase [Ignavibacteria bacterium]MCU7518180.1 zinc-binding dehydrogenase [Ignavibacteria bacterium]